MKKIIAIALCVTLAALLCACGGIRSGARNDSRQPDPVESAVIIAPSSTDTAVKATTEPATGTEAADVDKILKDLGNLTTGDDYEDITVEEQGADALQNEAQDILTDLGKKYDMPVN